MWQVQWTTDPNLEIWRDNCAFEDLQRARDWAVRLAELYPNRMVIVCKRDHLGAHTDNPRYIYGASANDLYRAVYGTDKPLNLGGLIENFDHHICD